MSDRKSSTISGDGTGHQDAVEISVIRSSDGKKCTISVPADLTKTTLNNLKDAISNNPNLGPLTREQQRLFHLGKEIKSGNRSLNAIGIGRFRVFSVHLHSLRPKTFELNDDSDEEDVVDVTDNSRDKPQEREGSGGDGRGVRGRREEKVVELLDSDSDDDVAEIVEVPGNKRRRKNEVVLE